MLELDTVLLHLLWTILSVGVFVVPTTDLIGLLCPPAFCPVLILVFVQQFFFVCEDEGSNHCFVPHGIPHTLMADNIIIPHGHAEALKADFEALMAC